ncbi:hypothetical protein HON52_04675 [Candidatus Uhrbacteria bacterium]|jgi:hypothetical protein|nr:hypothetical protein [Candidatus Uhrbacteria bacterium]
MFRYIVHSALVAVFLLGPDLGEGCDNRGMEVKGGYWLEVRGTLAELPEFVDDDVWRLTIEYDGKRNRHDCHSPECGELEVDTTVCLACVYEIVMDGKDIENCSYSSSVLPHVDTGDLP